MHRLILLVLLTFAGRALAQAPVMHPSRAFESIGAAKAAGAVVWLHGSYDRDDPPPPEPPFVARFAHDGYDIWRFDRPGPDPLAGSGAALTEDLKALKAQGYRRIIVAGHSRGAFVSLAALALSGVVDAVGAISPAAHGTNPGRAPQAIADYKADMAAATPMRLALVQLLDDPFDLDPDRRAEIARATASVDHMQLMLIDRPPEPVGHDGGLGGAFDGRYGACLTRFLEGRVGPDACAATPASRPQSSPP
jgi:pimeloyl-ACP methyl ester carboxylesterase